MNPTQELAVVAPASQDDTVTAELPIVVPYAAKREPSKLLVTVHRMRALAVCALLTGLAFVQQPGVIVQDTKIDLAVNPVGWLTRGLSMWNTTTNFGQVQNQEYGYLWPMGPFFAITQAVGMPAWASQRLWWALLLCVAFTGMLTLAGKLSIGTPTSRLIGALAFAIGPRMLTEIGAVSVEAWPVALAPWVLVPLVGLAHGARISRAVMLSALAVACAGGVNATAVFATVLLPALWLMTLHPFRRRLGILLSWSAAVLVACTWWLVPLFLMGTYTTPFMDFIETAPVTTRITDLVTTLRGTTAWLAYVGTWPAGRSLLTEGALVAAGIAVAALGLTGLARKGMPHRLFLVTGVLLGVALVGMGHVATVDGAFSQEVRQFLDGAGSPLRNVHKFDVVLRIPLILGFIHLIGIFQRLAKVPGRFQILARYSFAGLTGAALVAMTLIASPALAGKLPPTGGFTEVPAYWPATAAWLDSHLGRDRALIAPAARFPGYTWGTPADEIVQPLMSKGWAVRSAIPLTPMATIRLMDSVEAVLHDGRGSEGLAPVLARSGVRYLVMRYDLDYGKTRTTPPSIARLALAQSPGIQRVAGFGPIVGGQSRAGYYVDNGLDAAVQAVEIYEVTGTVSPVIAYPMSEVTTVVGGSESLINLASAGLLPAGPTVLAGDLNPAVSPGHTVLTDDLRKRELTFALQHDNASATMSTDEEWNAYGPAHDYLPSWADGYQTTQVFGGISEVRASSSWGEAQPLLGSRPEHLPYAALDGDGNTSWRTPPNAVAAGQWLRIGLQERMKLNQLEIIFDTGADNLPTMVTVGAGPEQKTVTSFSDRVTVELSGSFLIKEIQIRIDQALPARTGQGAVGIAEVLIPGLNASRSLKLPAATSQTVPDAVMLTAAPSASACYFIDGIPRCSAQLERGSEDGDVIDRIFDLPAGIRVMPTFEVRTKAGGSLNDLLDKEVSANAPLALGPAVTVSSTAFNDPAARAGAAIDDDPRTAWIASPEDVSPWLKIQWLTSRTLDGLRITKDPLIPGAVPWRVTVFGDGGTRHGLLDESGAVKFDPPLVTDKVTVLFRYMVPATTIDARQGWASPLPLAVGEIQALTRPERAAIPDGHIVSMQCGAGPSVSINGKTFQTSVRLSWAQALRRQTATAQLCGAESMVLNAGNNRIIAGGSELFEPVRLAFHSETSSAREGTHVTIDQWSGTSRTVTVDRQEEPQLLVMRENTNKGWAATLGGQQLVPAVVDGWQQAWVVPAGLAGQVQISFVPNRNYQLGLLIGGGLLVCLAVAAIVIPSRGPSKHRRRFASPRRRPGGFLCAVIGIAALVSVGGVVAAGLGVLAATGSLVLFFVAAKLQPGQRLRLRRFLRASWWMGPAFCLGIAGYLWWQAFQTTGGDAHLAGWPQSVALTGLGVLWISTVLGRRPFGKWLAILISGRSTAK